MLVVLALLSLLTVALSGVISLAISVRARVTSVALDQADIQSFDRILVQKLGRAVPARVSADRLSRIYFTGSSDHLKFLGPAFDAQGAALSFFDIQQSAGLGKPSILINVTAFDHVVDPVFEAYFAQGLHTLRFQYFGKPANGGPSAWQHEWINRSRLPDLISIQVTFPEGDHRLWPLIIIHPEIDGDDECGIDLNTHRCIGED